MLLKPYQKNVLKDLGEYLEYIDQYGKIGIAFNRFWEQQLGPYNPKEGKGMQPYQNNVNGCPHICIKVPTAGGKTFIAANALQSIFKHFSISNTKAVVWLVPSTSILQQTVRNLKNPSHPYRQRIASHFQNRIEIYDKESLIVGSNFSPSIVQEQLSIFILSFDTFRSRKKTDRKIYEENGHLAAFENFGTDTPVLPDIHETSLMQVIRKTKPVVVVDESHNATSELSVEMLRNLNPSFILELTATPKKNSNIISFVDAFELKKENMVKLPVIVYNHSKANDVIQNAISLREKLEVEAIEQHKQGGDYIRPIVLLQADTKSKTDNTTFEKIKEALLKCNIPEEQIKIKVSNNDELKKIDLLSKDCPVRYIITVNALKEGWDCSFAYILATVASRSSAVDVEQIVGRILRLPNAKKQQSSVLNLSYVLTASAKFQETLQKIVKGLNRAGFSEEDYRVGEEESQTVGSAETGKQQRIFEEVEEQTETIEEVVKTLNNTIESSIETNQNTLVVENILEQAKTAEAQSSKEIEEAKKSGKKHTPKDTLDKMKTYAVKDSFKDVIENIKLPQFLQSVPIYDMFETKTQKVLLDKKTLQENYKLGSADSNINFKEVDSQLYEIDLAEEETGPVYKKVDTKKKTLLLNYILSEPKDKQVKSMINTVLPRLGEFSSISEKEIRKYLQRIFEEFNNDQIKDFFDREFDYINAIRNKIRNLLTIYAAERFGILLKQDNILVEPHYQLPKQITSPKEIVSIPNSLYQKEGDMNTFEKEVIDKVANLDNVKFWHRNPSKTGFNINGFINHYPDFIVATNSGKILILETKGEHLKNDDSRDKIKLGKHWEQYAGKGFNYFMVFGNQPLEGSYSFDGFMDLVKGM